MFPIILPGNRAVVGLGFELTSSVNKRFWLRLHDRVCQKRSEIPLYPEFVSNIFITFPDSTLYFSKQGGPEVSKEVRHDLF
ncbi:Hypothetical protein NTJ_05102 [Nesidiocoris tenuis]|uniref:Uncharacterized protein n=1 Tax=Nesidiocoris tenuis TaxID=355587 RepID=A0ABN7AM31_9HEMI|nr:Hypothetical protein NTJ_05102 [Nesidiocoris tenuis]